MARVQTKGSLGKYGGNRWQKWSCWSRLELPVEFTAISRRQVTLVVDVSMAILLTLLPRKISVALIGAESEPWLIRLAKMLSVRVDKSAKTMMKTPMAEEM